MWLPRGVLLAQELRNGIGPGRRGEPQLPHRLQSRLLPCGDPQLTWTAGSLVAAVAGRLKAKPNLQGARPRRRGGGPPTAAVSGVTRTVYRRCAERHILFPRQHRGALPRDGRAPRSRTGRGCPSRARRRDGPSADRSAAAAGLSPRTPRSSSARLASPAGAPQSHISF